MSKVDKVYAECSLCMTELLLDMEYTVNNDLIPVIVRAINKHRPKVDGWLPIIGDDNDKRQPCWILYDNTTCNNAADTWKLFAADGTIVVSKSRTARSHWSHDEVAEFSHTIDNTDTAHHGAFSLARTFFGLLRLAKKCGVYDKAASRSLENNFNALYGQYNFIKASRLIMTGMK